LEFGVWSLVFGVWSLHIVRQVEAVESLRVWLPAGRFKSLQGLEAVCGEGGISDWVKVKPAGLYNLAGFRFCVAN
jgi:hypothetical protein